MGEREKKRKRLRVRRRKMEEIAFKCVKETDSVLDGEREKNRKWGGKEDNV